MGDSKLLRYLKENSLTTERFTKEQKFVFLQHQICSLESLQDLCSKEKIKYKKAKTTEAFRSGSADRPKLQEEEGKK